MILYLMAKRLLTFVMVVAGVTLIAGLLIASPVWAGGVFPLMEGQDIIGLIRQYEAGRKETLHEVAWDYGIGYNEIVDANPDVDPWVPEHGERVVLPTMWALPGAPREGIVINLAEMRLYAFWELNGRKVVSSFPIGVGLEGADTPLGTYTISSKVKNPSWHVPWSMRKEDPSLPRVVPPGDENPLGDFAMRLSGSSYLVHGTNNPFGIGRRVSQGCIRLYPEDIRKLFALTRMGDKVMVVYQPVKVAEQNGKVFVEVHKDYQGRMDNLTRVAASILRERGLFGRVDKRLLWKAVRDARGYPVPVGKPPVPTIKAASRQEGG